jgi:hypothetical protein
MRTGIILREDPEPGFPAPVLFSFRMEDAQDPEDIMAGLPVDCKIIKPADILKKDRVWGTADGREVYLHLDAADILKLAGIDDPFGAFAIAFQKIAPAAHGDEIPERVRGGENATVVPGDLRRSPAAKGTGDYLYGNIIEPDIFKKRACGHRFHRSDMPADSRSPDTEPADICADIKDPVCRPDIIEPVLGH